MKIAFHINGVDVGGVAAWTRSLAEGLKERSHELLFIANVRGDFAESLADIGPVVYLNAPMSPLKGRTICGIRVHDPRPILKNILLGRRVCADISQLVKEHRINVLLGNGPGGLLTSYSSKKTGIPLIYCLHTLSERGRDIGGFITSACARQLNKGTHVVGVSEHALLRYRNRLHVPESVLCNACRNMYAPIRRESVRGSLNVPFGAVVLGTLGRITEKKGCHLIIEAFAQVARGNRNVYLLIAGTSSSTQDRVYLERLRLQAESLGVSDRVVFHGKIEPECFYNAIDIFVLFPVNKESFGLVVIEAMSAKVPVIASAEGGPVEILKNSKAGELVEPQNIEALSTAIGRLVSDPERRKKMGAAGYIEHQNKYDADAWVEKWEGLLVQMKNGESV